jgi:hypothetical protein
MSPKQGNPLVTKQKKIKETNKLLLNSQLQLYFIKENQNDKAVKFTETK